MITRFLTSSLLASKKSTLLLGPRQVGKSTLTRSLNPSLTIQLADESVFQAHLRDPGLISRQVLAHPEQRSLTTLVLIDEVQRIPSLLNTVQALIDDHGGRFRFLLTGSSARKLKRGQANLLPGRVISHQLYPITFWESPDAHTQDQLPQRLRLGQLPEIVSLAQTPDQAIATLRSYSQIYLREEIQAEALTRDLGAYARFLDTSAELSGHYFNYAKVGSDIEINKQTIRRFFEILEDTLLIHRLAPFTATRSTRKVRQTDRFIYFDLGVRNAILRKLTSEFTPTELGPLFEQWIILQLIAYQTYQGKEWNLSSFRDEFGNEVDLVIETDRSIIAVEIRYQKSYRKEFGRGLAEFERLIKKSKSLSKVIVTLGSQPELGPNGETILPYTQFLSEYVPGIL